MKMETNSNIILDFSSFTEVSFKTKILEIRTKEESQAIHTLWNEISEVYHTIEEGEFLLSILKGNEDKHILDPAFGSGFPLRFIKKHNFFNLYASDIPSNNLLEPFCKMDGIKYFHSSFKHLDINTIRKNFDIILVIGASLSYCQSWNLSDKTKNLEIQEVYNSLNGLKSVLNENGILYIGNAKTYHSGNNEDNLSYYDNNQNLKMRWIPSYDWKKKKKNWKCIFYNEKTEEKFNIELESHLFSNQMLIEYCQKYFEDVELIESPVNCPEDLIKCSKPKI